MLLPLAWLLALTPPLIIGGALPAQQPVKSAAAVRPLKDVRAAAAEIDALVQQDLAAHGEHLNPIVDDPTFLRRSYLSIVGRIPTRTETEAFLADHGSDRRERLVEHLLDAPGRTSHESNWFADLLRARSRLMRQISGEPFLHWLKDAIASDKHFDAMVGEMLTAQGAAHQRGNGATGYLLRDLNMPHDAMANTLRVFLGTRLECAQCHNHPFETWTQVQFYEMAAFFGGIRYRTDIESTDAGKKLLEAARGNTQSTQAARRILQQAAVGISGTGTGVERLPKDYKYEDQKPLTPVFAATIFGAQVTLPHNTPPMPRGGKPQQQARGASGQQVDSRGKFAAWLTSADNPRFAEVIANRMWQKLFGRGLIDPVDDIKATTVASNPELMARLTRLMVEVDFDLRQFQRVLLHTQLFQRATPANDPPEGAIYRFGGPLLRRMTAEQMWDSLLTLVFDDLDARIRPADARARDVYARHDQVMQADTTTFAGEVANESMRASDPQKFQAMQREKQQEKQRASVAEQQQKQREARPVLQQLAAAKKKGDNPQVAALEAQLRQLGVAVPGERAARGNERDLLRASDLQEPAPAGHLLRQFGQSDRETVDGANAAANVPQVLTLLNGFLDQRVLAGNSSLQRDLAACKTPDDTIRTAYTAVLNRRPSPAELAEWRATLRDEGQDGTKDLVWVLCNSHEFRFVR